jgi:hypothetical protein
MLLQDCRTKWLHHKFCLGCLKSHQPILCRWPGLYLSLLYHHTHVQNLDDWTRQWCISNIDQLRHSSGNVVFAEHHNEAMIAIASWAAIFSSWLEKATASTRQKCSLECWRITPFQIRKLSLSKDINCTLKPPKYSQICAVWYTSVSHQRW